MKTLNKQKIIGVKELRNNLDNYISLVNKGRTFIVVKRSRPVFKITPIDEDEDGQWETIVDFTKIKKGGVPIEDVWEALNRIDKK